MSRLAGSRLGRMASYVAAFCCAWLICLGDWAQLAGAQAARRTGPTAVASMRVLAPGELTSISGQTTNSCLVQGVPDPCVVAMRNASEIMSGSCRPGVSCDRLARVVCAASPAGQTSTSQLVGKSSNSLGPHVDLELYHSSRNIGSTGFFGRVWASTWDQHVSEAPGGNVTVFRKDHTLDEFTRNVDGSYTAPPGVHDVLVKHTALPMAASR